LIGGGLGGARRRRGEGGGGGRRDVERRRARRRSMCETPGLPGREEQAIGDKENENLPSEDLVVICDALSS
jgi:hypothetical protein